MMKWLKGLFGSNEPEVTTPYKEQPVKHELWTEEDKVFVMKTELPIGQVADELGRSPDAIRSMRKRIKAAQSE